jgi:hypothetical protein
MRPGPKRGKHARKLGSRPQSRADFYRSPTWRTTVRQLLSRSGAWGTGPGAFPEARARPSSAQRIWLAP